jgi:hypothetical protein
MAPPPVKAYAMNLVEGLILDTIAKQVNDSRLLQSAFWLYPNQVEFLSS